MKLFILLLIILINNSYSLFEDWIVKPSYVTECALDFLPDTIYKNCKCQPSELVNLYTSGKLNSIQQGGTAEEIINNIMSDDSLINELCKRDGCANELFSKAINFEALGLGVSSYGAIAIEKLGGYVCEQAKTHTSYCISEFLPLAKDLQGQSFENIMTSNKLSTHLQNLCVNGCLDKLSPYQNDLKILVDEIGGQELKPLSTILDVEGSFNSICSDFDGCEIETERKCVQTGCKDDCELGICDSNKCNSETHGTSGFIKEVSNKECCMLSVFGVCVADGVDLKCCKDIPTGKITCPTAPTKKPTKKPTVKPTMKPTKQPTINIYDAALIDEEILKLQNCNYKNDDFEDLLEKISNKGVELALNQMLYNLNINELVCSDEFKSKNICQMNDILKSINKQELIDRNIVDNILDADSLINSLIIFANENVYCIKNDADIKIADNQLTCFTEASEFYYENYFKNQLNLERRSRRRTTTTKSTSSIKKTVSKINNKLRKRELQMDDLPFKDDKLTSVILNCNVGGLLGLTSKFEAAGGDIITAIFTDAEIAEVLCTKPKCPNVAVKALDPAKLPAKLQDPEVLKAMEYGAEKLCIKNDNDDFCLTKTFQKALFIKDEENNEDNDYCENGCVEKLGNIDNIQPLLTAVVEDEDIEINDICDDDDNDKEVDFEYDNDDDDKEEDFEYDFEYDNDNDNDYEYESNKREDNEITKSPTTNIEQIPEKLYCKSKCNERLLPVWKEFMTIVKIVGKIEIPNYADAEDICTTSVPTKTPTFKEVEVKPAAPTMKPTKKPINTNDDLDGIEKCQQYFDLVSENDLNCEDAINIPDRCCVDEACLRFIALSEQFNFINQERADYYSNCIQESIDTKNLNTNEISDGNNNDKDNTVIIVSTVVSTLAVLLLIFLLKNCCKKSTSQNIIKESRRENHHNTNNLPVGDDSVTANDDQVHLTNESDQINSNQVELTVV